MNFKRGINPKKSLSLGIKEYYKENPDALFEDFKKLGIGKVTFIEGNCVFVDILELAGAGAGQFKTIKWFRENTYYYINSPGELQPSLHSRNFTLMNKDTRRWKFYWVSKTE